MTEGAEYLLHLALFGAFPFYFMTLSPNQRTASFYVYLGIVLAYGGMLGSVYSVSILGQVLSAGNLTYGTFMMATIMLIIVQRDLSAFRNVIRLVITVNLFVYLLFALARHMLEVQGDRNPAQIPAQLFDMSISIVILGGVLIVLELLVMLALFERLKRFSWPEPLTAFAYTLVFIGVLIADGLLFPVIASGITPDVIGTLPGKLILGLSFGIPLFTFFLLFNNQTQLFTAQRLALTELVARPNRRLREEIRAQQQLLEMSEGQLREMARKLSLTSRAVGIGLWEFDYREQRLSWDDRTCELYQVAPETFDGRIESWLVHILDEDQLAGITAYFRGERVQDSLQMILQIGQNSATSRYIEIQSSEVREPDGTRKEVGICRDMTLQHRLEEEHMRLQEQLFQSQKMESIRQFAGGIAHDFNNLLIPIIGYAELEAEKLEANNPLRDSLNQIISAAEKARVLIRKLLALGRQLHLEARRQDLNMVVKELIPVVRRLVGKDIELVIKPHSEEIPIWADRGQLEQMMLNLCANARDAMPGGGALTICTNAVFLDENFAAQHPGAEPGAHAEILITDTGCGMDKETMDRVFEPFFTTKQGDGSGLGLATSFGIVKEHSGSIWVDSQRGKGTTFRVLLPIHGGPVATARTGQNRQPTLTGNEKVLLVEDDEGVLEFVRRTLQSNGYQVIDAMDPQTAIASYVADAASIDLIISDVVMPRLSGPEMVDEFLQRNDRLHVLYISGYKADIIDPPPDHLLQKPFSMHELLNSVRDCLDETEALSENQVRE